MRVTRMHGFAPWSGLCYGVGSKWDRAPMRSCRLQPALVIRFFVFGLSLLMPRPPMTGGDCGDTGRGIGLVGRFAAHLPL